MYNNTAFGILIGFAFVCLLVLFCAIMIRLYINKLTKYNRVIFQKDIDFQKTLNSTIIETQEQLLNNISQDLHDDAGQQLTYINFQVENLKLDSPDLDQKLQPISDSVTNLSRSVRNISHSLNNQLLLQQDLLKAIKAEVERMQNNGHLNISLEISGDGKGFDTNEKIVLYRIFQEVINNALKHSKAKAIVIHIDAGQPFQMKISDNGRGFDPDGNQKATLGLSNMHLRANAINYNLVIQSKPNDGTTVIISEI